MKHIYLLSILVVCLISGCLLSLNTSFTEHGLWEMEKARKVPSDVVAARISPREAHAIGTPVFRYAAAALTNKLFQTADAQWQEPSGEDFQVEFRTWTQRYLASNTAERTNLVAEGVQLAAVRRDRLKQLIRSNPERALELTIPTQIRAELPAAVTGLLEQRVNTRGKFAVLGVLPEPGRANEVPPTIRTATIGGQEYQTYTYGERLAVPTRNDIGLLGVTVDNLFAFSANALRILDEYEAATALARNPDPICSVTSQSAAVASQPVVVELAGAVIFYCRPEHAAQQNAAIVAADGGPPSPDGGDPAASTWTEGQKKLLLIRVDFSDLAGVNLTDGSAVTLLNNLNGFYREMSYGRASFTSNGLGSDFTPVFRMSQPAGYYGTNDFYNQLRTEARNAATTAGYVLTNYDFDVICFGAVPGWGWSGLGYVGSSGAWLRNSFGTGVAAHELGHNFGLNHANLWNTGGASVMGPGSSSEYGDGFDTMGAASAGNNHFNARYKRYLNWLTADEIITVTTNGTYRIVCHDDPVSTGIRGLTIVKNNSTNYWVEFRQKFTGNKWLQSGAGLRWAQSGNQKSQLLDTTPGSPDGINDSAIVIGRTFSDPDAGIHITPIGKGGTSPESLDVVVNLGMFPGNHSPRLDLSASATNVFPGDGITFNATADDSDGDSLAYYWDFGDGTFGTNSATGGKSWSVVGDYLVRCVVSDMKGGEASRWVVVRVGQPVTYSIRGNVVTATNAVQGVRVYVSGTRMGYTDTDGNYAILGLPAGAYDVSSSLYGYAFTPRNFTNSVNLGPDLAGVDFLAQPVTYPPSISTQPFSQTVLAGSLVSFSVVAGGTGPLTYQWRINDTNILGADQPSLQLVNVQTTHAGNYSVVVSSPYGAITSANANLTLGNPPNITMQPHDQRVVAGNTATFAVSVTGTPRLNYLWQRNGTNLVGEKPGSANSSPGDNYVRTNVQPNDSGLYSVIIANQFGSVTSSPATLVVSVRPQLSPLQVVDGIPQFLLTGTPGDHYAIEASTNHLDWIARSTITNQSGSVLYTDVDTLFQPAMFYRGRLVE